MPYRIHARESSAEAMHRIASEPIGSALPYTGDEEADLHETVHEVRKRCKKIRGLIRLFRPSFPPASAEDAEHAEQGLASALADRSDAVS